VDAKTIETTPHWAWGWYFIPFANLWKPYGVMSQICSGSIDPDNRYAETPKTLPLWWGCWIITNFVSNVSNRMSKNAGYWEDYITDLPLYKTSLTLDILSGLLSLIAAWTILRIWKIVTDKQDGMIAARLFT
jgi:hypothetical protein